MKNQISLTLLLCFNFFTPVHAQWMQSEQPTGGMCWGIERVGNDIWAGYNYGVYISSNEGATWYHHPTINSPVLDIVAIGDTIIYLTQEHPSIGVYNLSTISSYDGGVTWNAPVVAETGNSYYLSGIREMHVTSHNLIIKSSGAHYVSDDWAQSWLPLTTPLNATMTAIGDKYLVCYTYNSSYSNFYSGDGGITWNFLDSSYMAYNALVIDSTIYISTVYNDSVNHSFIARTSDFGQTWDTLGFDLIGFAGSLDYFNNKINYAYYPYPQPPVMYESADGGDTWTLNPVPDEIHWFTSRNTLILSNWEWIVGEGTLGIYRYNPTTQVFYHTETGIKAKEITFLKNNKGVLYTRADNQLYTSVDAGATWAAAPSFVHSQSDFVFKGDTVFGITYPTGNRLCHSYDNGLTWDSTISTGCWQTPESMLEMDGKLYIGGNSNAAVSSDWGASWTCLGTLVDSGCFSNGVNATHLASFNHELFAFDDFAGQISKYDSVSQSWINKLCIFMPGVQYSMLFSSGDRLAATGGSQFLVSADSGNTWYAPARNGFPSGYRPNSLSLINGAWFSPCNGKLYYTFDYGDNWIQFPTNTDMFASSYSDELVTEMNGILYAGGNNVWKSDDTLQLISGTVYFDNNNNGIKDTGEDGIPGIILHTTPNNIAFSTNANGSYSFFTAAIGDTLKPALPGNYCMSNPSYYLTNGAAGNVDFGIYFYPGVQDRVVDMTNRNIFRPGFNTKIDVMVKNNGTVAIPGILQVILDTSLTYINASVTPTQINGDTLIFAMDTLQFFESETITLDVETFFTVPITTPVFCSAAIFPLIGDTVPADNYSEIVTTVTGSYDPNDKTAACGPYFTPAQLQNGDEMIYTIRFQNTGNFQADNIHIIDTLSQFFVLKDFRIISSSHLMHYTMEGSGIVTFYFDNIFLPPIITDEPGSHGFVKYAIRCNQNLSIGDAIDNTAYIYFDFNAPVQTNTETIIIADPPLNANTTEVPEALRMTIYPNPATNTLNGIFNSGKSKSFTLTVLSQIGQSVKTSSYTGDRFSTEINDLPAGLYYGKIIIQGSGESLFFRFIVVK